MMLRLAVRNLFRNPRRTLALLLTVASGTTALFMFQGFNFGIMNQYKENTIHSRYGHGQINLSGYREQVFEKPWEHWIDDAPEVIKELQSLQSVDYVFPRIEFFSLITNGRVTIAGRGQGVSGVDEAKFFTTLNVEEGKALSSEEDGILLGRGLARALDAKPGDRVTVLSNTIHGSMNGGDFVVTGIFHTGVKEFDDSIFRIQIKQAQVLLDTTRVESIALGLKNENGWTEIKEWVKAKPKLEATPFEILDKVYYQQSVDWLNQQFAVTQIIILSIVVLGIFNTVSTSILERRPEIGNLRANGESSLNVFSLLLIEGALIGFIAAVLGVIVGLALNLTLLKDGILMPPAPGLTRQFAVRIEFLPQMAMWAIGLNSLTTLIGTGLAAWKTSKMPIAAALRST